MLDIAAVAARALGGSEHDGRTYELNGPEALTCAEVADRISRHAGTAARYVVIPAAARRKAMLDQGMPEWQVTALLELQEYYTGGCGGVVDGVLQGLLGRPPITIDRFLDEFAAEFRPRGANACEDHVGSNQRRTPGWRAEAARAFEIFLFPMMSK